MRRTVWAGVFALVLAGAVRAQEPDGSLRRIPPTQTPEPVAAPAPAAEILIEAEPGLVETGPPPKLWEGSFELGLNGNEGNSQTFNVRFGVDAKRKTPRSVFSLDFDYHRNTSDSDLTAHRAFLDWRYEWLLVDSPWTLFVHGTDDYDEFRPFDMRITTDAGVGRELIDTECTSFLARVGAGVVRELGGSDDRYVPTLALGLDLDHRISKRQKVTATVDYTPDVTDFNDFRVNSKAAWELLLDEEANLSLKLTVLDRYDNTPGGGVANDIDYAIVLLWSF